ncbi:serine/threonine-protein kinase ULK3 [Anolis carolinensis]|uniref:serine/threonine-protein kinase ULK3 n=1 Tax=Anolis carolinensis TaxID=28377 RepID=UPI000462A334|nr:PREDICTED: serine/threonine-protein kinase ULK3 [Anolis carolinensis]|eukprot:XP_003227575.2 PREDICTED: serine/threonine-protein kinase ULK3 [Anolis carolinensis]
MAGSGSWAPPQLEDFILTERLGSGTYATVFKAYRKRNTREVVAIKCVNKKSLNKASVENLLTEIEILKTIRHPHIVELKDFQWDKEYIYLIMEFCAGGDLSRFIHSRRILPEKVARLFLQQLACALKFLHDKNISHLDLKPQNILLSTLDKPHLKLADFGFAQHMSPRDEKHVLRGSPLYMAPEMVCSRQYDARVDLWSVGVILYEALFGRPPFASKSFAELEEKIRSNQPIELPSRPRLSPECRDLLQRLLKRDPQQRLSFQAFFAHPFVDMEHMPSGESLGKATALVTEAVKKDQAGDASSALSLYSKALEYFVPALYYETDIRRKEAIRSKVSQYISRAEQLKVLVASNNKTLLQQGCPARDILKEMSKDKPRLYAALEIASAAVAKEEEGKDDGETLDLYQQSLGELLLMLAAEPTGRRRELLHTEIQTLMGRAEYLKEQIKMKESQWEAETIDKEGMSDSVRSSCTVQ